MPEFAPLASSSAGAYSQPEAFTGSGWPDAFMQPTTPSVGQRSAPQSTQLSSYPPSNRSSQNLGQPVDAFNDYNAQQSATAGNDGLYPHTGSTDFSQGRDPRVTDAQIPHVLSRSTRAGTHHPSPWAIEGTSEETQVNDPSQMGPPFPVEDPYRVHTRPSHEAHHMFNTPGQSSGLSSVTSATLAGDNAQRFSQGEAGTSNDTVRPVGGSRTSRYLAGERSSRPPPPPFPPKPASEPGPGRAIRNRSKGSRVAGVAFYRHDPLASQSSLPNQGRQARQARQASHVSSVAVSVAPPMPIPHQLRNTFDLNHQHHAAPLHADGRDAHNLSTLPGAGIAGSSALQPSGSPPSVTFPIQLPPHPRNIQSFFEDTSNVPPSLYAITDAYHGSIAQCASMKYDVVHSAEADKLKRRPHVDARAEPSLFAVIGGSPEAQAFLVL